MNEIELHRDGAVSRLAINRIEKSNALSTAMMERVADLVAEMGEGTVLVIEARGERGFSAGADIAELAQGTAALERQEAAMLALAQALVDCRALKVTLLHGYAKGGSAIFPCLSDLVLAREDTSISFPEIAFRMYPVLLHALLTQRVPQAIAWQLCATGRALGAHEAHRLGLVTEVLPATGFREAAERRIAAFGELRATLALGRRFMQEAATLPLDAQMRLAGTMMHDNVALPGVSSAIENYAARVTGRIRKEA